MNRFGHGGRQKRLIIGQVRVKVENLSAARPLESIVRKVSCDIPAGRGERLSKKKGKKKGDASDKKTGFRLEIKLFIVSPFRGHCGETINGNKIRLIARKSSPVRRFRFISDDDLTRFQNLFRISPFFFPSFFFIFNFFLLSFFFITLRLPAQIVNIPFSRAKGYRRLVHFLIYFIGNGLDSVSIQNGEWKTRHTSATNAA